MREKTLRLALLACLLVALGRTAFGADCVSKMVRESIIIGEITLETPAYDSYAPGKRIQTQFWQGEAVEIIRDRNFEWYYVRGLDGREGWISVESILIPEDPETNGDRLPPEVLEAYVNQNGFTSQTDQFVWVDIDRQLTYVFTGDPEGWKLKRIMPCSTGKNASPTLRGLHKIGERGEWFFTERLDRGGKHWVQFSGPYLFHSLPMDKHGNITDETLLERRSSGCIRLSMEDSQWFYSFIKRNSAVFVN